jgi:flagellar hook-length control protein FliK
MMISSARPPAASGNCAKAGATTAAPQAIDSSAAPFDSVLALETLAAEANAAPLDLAAAGQEGGLEELQDDLLPDDDADADEGDDVALGPLALLGMLVNAAVVPQATAAKPGDDAGAIDDVLSGGGDSAGDGAQGGLPVPSQPGSAGSSFDAGAADKLLAGIASADAPRTADTSSDATQSNDAVNRAAEWMTHGVRHAAATEHAPLTTHVRDPRWAEEFGTRIALMVRGGESSASLQLTPVDLGPMEVSITVRDGQASVHFGAAQAETRQLIEASIPRLREMLAAQGFNLMDASVSQGFSRQARPDAPRPTQRESEPAAEPRATTHLESTRLLDTYA